MTHLEELALKSKTSLTDFQLKALDAEMKADIERILQKVGEVK